MKEMWFMIKKHWKLKNLQEIGLQSLSKIETKKITGGNGIHGAGYGAAGDGKAVGEFWYGFFRGLLRY